tara:strand:+ start:476 stop:724 length:249 start_codon:yes stop_codon:yes gene_type:complete
MYSQLIIESIVFGIIIVFIGTIISNIIGNFHKKTKTICKDWNKNHIMEIALFLTGFFSHLICEFSGINKWYCKNSFACKKSN